MSHPVAYRGLMIPGANAWLYAPYHILVLYWEMWEIHVQKNCLPRPFPFAKGLHTTKTSPQVRIMTRKKLYESRTTYATIPIVTLLWNVRAKRTEFSMLFLVRKKWNPFQKERWRSPQKKQYVFQRIVLGAESVLTARNDVLSENFTILFWSFLQKLKAKSPSRNRHAWYRPMTKCALPLKLKQSRQDTIETKRSSLVNPTLNKQVYEVSVFVHCAVCFVLIMAFTVKW